MVDTETEMSDAAISTIVTGFITIATIVVGFLTMWVKLRYGTEQAKEAATKAKVVEEKIDANAKAVEEKLDANVVLSKKIDNQTNGNLDQRLAQLNSKTGRITELETKVNVIETKLESLDKNINSTRHEMRGHFQSVTNSLNLLNARQTLLPPKELPPSPSGE
jgi:uncharacterized protein involved in exopolysaccharide biosynthesis